MSVLRNSLDARLRRASGLSAALVAFAFVDPSTAASRAVASAAECPPSGTRVVGFARAVDGAGFVTSEGEEVRLSSVLAVGAGGENVSPEQVASARETLTRTLSGKTISLGLGEAPRDRYGRTLAQVFADGAWVQAALLKAGEVRAAPDRASAACAEALLAAEAEARERRPGQWRTGRFRLLDPGDLGNRTGSFQIVEGEVVTASVVRGRAFINFGADYRTDFTVTIAPEDMRTFRQAKFDVPALKGRRIRVRGWIEFYNGPEIAITTPAAIEIPE